jgi:hypothetical protein
MTTMIGALLLLLGFAGAASAQELRSVNFSHAGSCDGTFHVVPAFAPTQPVRIVRTRVLVSGTGPQGVYLGRQSDGLFLAYATHEGVTTVMSPEHVVSTPITLTVQPGDAIQLVHWCNPPDVYDIWSLIEYVIP